MNGRHASLVGVAAAALVVAVAGPVRVRAAGNVTATVSSGGVLTIKGDADGNGIHITPAGGSSYDIAPSDATTTINGASDFIAAGVTGDVKISLGDGDDTLIIEDTNAQPFPDDLTIRTGGGNDSVELN